MLSWITVNLRILCMFTLHASVMLPNKGTPAHCYSACCSCEQ